MTEDLRVKSKVTEINRVDQSKSLKKKKREDVQIKKVTAVLCEAI